MKSIKLYPVTALACLALLWAPALSAQEAQQPVAQETDEATTDEATAQEEIQEKESAVDQMAATPEGEKTVEQNIIDQYVVDESVIRDLREKKLGYGEIMTTLSLADQMEGGINEQNIQTIVDLRSGETKKGWGEIAKQFNVKVGDLKKSFDGPAQGRQNKDILPVTKNLHNSPANKPAQVPKGK